MQDTIPYLVETIKTGNPPTLLERIDLVRVEHHRGHDARIAAPQATKICAVIDRATGLKGHRYANGLTRTPEHGMAAQHGG
ncbi:MAG TPA: hypothetical protein VNV37_10635 [Solirubrobacteraceae bacterium]|nr:hypothetical protein [Solirubrobacteraceae bacterium]